jgi:putative NADH-flavin reductase
MTGKEIIDAMQTVVQKVDTKDAIIAAYQFAQTQMMELHARTLAAHCECLAMNADNCIAAIVGGAPIPHDSLAYAEVLRKWSIIDEKGQPLI